MKKTYRAGILLFLLASFVLALSAQDGEQSLGDLARQERERRQQQSGDVGQTGAGRSQDKDNESADAREISGLKEATFKANILIANSHDAIEKWVTKPEAERPAAGRIRQVTFGKKYYLPFVVTGYSWPTSERMNLAAHVRLISQDGKTQFDSPRFSWAIAPDPKSATVIVLNPVMDITFDSNDLPGTYVVRVTITDHVHLVYAKAEEQFQLLRETTR